LPLFDPASVPGGGWVERESVRRRRDGDEPGPAPTGAIRRAARVGHDLRAEVANIFRARALRHPRSPGPVGKKGGAAAGGLVLVRGAANRSRVRHLTRAGEATWSTSSTT